MSDTRITFIDLVLRDQAALDAIDDFVDLWHDDPRGRELHSFLGLTADEYALWVRRPDMLAQIIERRREQMLSGHLVG